MTQTERLEYLITCLIKEQPEYEEISIPTEIEEKKRLLRSLMNVRPAVPISREFLRIQDEYLKNELTQQEITELNFLTSRKDNMYLWKGDITKLKVDAIVNAGNSALLGCFIPCHGCIDNAIHSNAGIQLRLECQKNNGKARETGADGKSKNHKGLQSSGEICSAYCWSDCPWAIDRKRPYAACSLLSFLSGVGGCI